MQVSKDFLVEAVGLSILVALIFISMQLFHRAERVAALIEEKQLEQISELEEYEIVKFEGMVIDGITAISYIKRIIGKYGLFVVAETSNHEFVISRDTDYGELRNANSEKYIPPFAKYFCSLSRDENEVITSVRIEIIREGD